MRRKAAKRTLPWDLAAEEIELAIPPQQDEDIQETKRPRLEEPPPTTSTTDGADRKTVSPDVSVFLLLPLIMIMVMIQI